MLSLAIAVVISASIMRAASTLKESRFKPQYFTRKRILPFQDLLKYLLSMHKTSSQSALNNFLERKGVNYVSASLEQGSQQVRSHTISEAVYGCQRCVLQYEIHSYASEVHDKFLIAIDGSETPLPNLPALLKKFGGTGAKASSPTARMSIAYDVLNDFIIDAAFSPLNISERVHAKNHFEAVGKIIA